jgi:hypothetical protein
MSVALCLRKALSERPTSEGTSVSFPMRVEKLPLSEMACSFLDVRDQMKLTHLVISNANAVVITTKLTWDFHSLYFSYIYKNVFYLHGVNCNE